MDRHLNLRSLPLFLAAALVLLIPIKSRAADQKNAAKTEKLFRQLGITSIQKTVPLDGMVLNLKGEKVALSSFRGNVAFLTFWTTWCPSCRVEMPALQKLYAHYQDEGFLVLAVNIQEPAVRVAEYFKAKGLSYTSLLDPRGQLARRLGVQGIPNTFILDRAGMVMGRAVGSRHWDSPEGRQLIKLLLNE